jgi:DNA-directed RNA polymerase alpha subunit
MHQGKRMRRITLSSVDSPALKYLSIFSYKHYDYRKYVIENKMFTFLKFLIPRELNMTVL